MSEHSPQLPPYWLPRPPAVLDDATRAAFDELLAEGLARGAGEPLAYRLSAPKWQFLCYLADAHGLALHGSQQRDITCFEPRQPHDLHDFGAQLAVYAAADGLWPMYFAILDRATYPTALINACLRLTAPDGTVAGPFYLFSIGRHVIDRRPYAPGTVYLLPRASFVPEPPFTFGEVVGHTAQLASPDPVTPLAKIVVTPEDFPFLEQMGVHDDERLAEYAAAIRALEPWPGEVSRGQ
jgi:hypothetical protein